MPQFNEELRTGLCTRLSAHQRVSYLDTRLRHAAVALAIIGDEAGRACFVLTRRGPRLRAHAGQLALPGGGVDPGETAVEAAQRELDEEVGISQAELLGLLDDYPTRSGYRITPVVVWVEHTAKLLPNPAEVVAVHRIPLSELERSDSPQFATDIPDAHGPVVQVPINELLIHAPTGAVLYQFAEVALRGRITRVAHFDEPPRTRH